MMGASAGLALRYDGGWMSGGSWRSVLEMALCTSCAAASTSRSSENCRVMDVDPSVLVDVMLSMPGMVLNAFSSGVATAEAMVCGLAPGRLAFTETVG